MFCSLVARAFRRALCGAPSRRGSGDSYQELTAPPALQDDDQRREVNIDVTEQNARYQTVDETTPLKPQISIEDLVLLEKMGTGPVCTGRFLTVHKRRRKKLTTRSLNQNHAILDDIQHGQVQWILDRCGMWAFNAFALENAAGGRSLPVLCVHLFHWYGLLDHFHLDVVRIWKLFTLIEEGYHSTNPYHNSIHATDVTQAMHCFLQEEKIRKHVTPLEVMASLIGAVAHDLDHPGVNQHFLISTSNHLAILYQNSSVLENHHWRSAVGCLLESGVAEQLLPYRAELELQIRDLILATDINRQQEFLTTFKEYLDTKTLRVENKTDRHFILQIALKCADISNPTRPWDISHKWSLKVCDEFFRQGEFERQLNLPITSICDQQSTSVAKIQVGFFRFVVTPLYQEWHRFLQSSLSAYLMEMLEVNRKKWEKQEAMEQAEETHTELSDAEVEAELTEDEVTKENSDTVTTITDFVTPPQREIRRQSLAVPTLEGILDMRRHSMPLHIEQRLPCNLVARRESVPGRQSESPVRSISRGSSSAREDHGFVKNDSQMSIVSSESPHYSSACEEERPLSAENLLPETSITSITSNVAARRIATLIRGGTGAPVTKALTRQQTFPPPQPYVRMRYMSATAEMSACKESVYEDSKSDTSHNSSQENISPTAVPQYPIPSIAVLSPNNNRPVDMLTPSSPEQQTASAVKTNGNKRDQETSADKNCKMVKLSENSQHHEKENVDPTKLMSGVSLIHRRGSAPVTITLAHQEEAPSAGGGLCTFEAHFLRRSSVPFEITCYHVEEDDQMEDATTTTTSDTCPLLPSERRGSAPTDIFVSRSFVDRCGTEQLTRHTSLNGKSASSRRKKLHRRSSGGPETVCLQPEGGEAAASSGLRLLRKSDNPDTLLLAQRRGSLPIEVLTVGHSVF